MFSGIASVIQIAFCHRSFTIVRLTQPPYFESLSHKMEFQQIISLRFYAAIFRTWTNGIE
jgi:TRAP-type C4-dicarboxylate transport system substrate-binding protein